MTIALILAVARRLAEGANVQSGEWPGWRHLHARPRLAGKRLGIVGMGRIGQAVARRARAFGSRSAIITATGCRQIEEELRRLLGEPRPDARPGGHRLDQLPAHARDVPPPLGSPARADPAEAYVINTARGEIIDEAALIRCSGRATSPARASTCSSMSPRSIRSSRCSPARRSCWCRTWARRRSKAGPTWAKGDRQYPRLHGRPQAAGPGAAGMLSPPKVRRRLLRPRNPIRASRGSTSAQKYGASLR